MPRTIQIERDSFNAAVAGTGVHIGTDIFSHSIGNPDSYPTRADVAPVIGTFGRRVGPVDVGASPCCRWWSVTTNCVNMRL